jgi:uncharacterized protein (TIGR04552 family)
LTIRPSSPPSRNSGPPPALPEEQSNAFGPSLSSQLKSLDEFDLHDVEAIRLILRGGSVIDWHRLNCVSEQQARRLVEQHGLDLSNDGDLAFTEQIRDTAISYLRRHFNFSIPRPVENSSITELILMASGRGHRQLCACSILKTMHIINHMTGRELLFRLPVSDKDVFQLVEERIYRVVGNMLSAGFPIVEFIGGRKNLDSTYTKLLSKKQSTASALYDKLRFRIVTRTKDDILPVLLYLAEHVFPYNYIVPGESTNTLFHFRSYCEASPHLREMIDSFQGELDEALVPGDNTFSAANYRVIHFVADVPVRVPEHMTAGAPPGCESLGPVVFVLCEFQMLDAETDAANEVGDASHEAYKQRQRAAVYNRLRLGARQSSGPPDPDAWAEAPEADED